MRSVRKQYGNHDSHPFFVFIENERKCQWQTLKTIDTRFINLTANLFQIIIFRFILLRKLFSKFFLLIGSTEN